ncbi:MAG: adenosylcobinamide-phosphate synthase CbiB [Gemmatimonadetes bacterium]|nr:adenosylcobinamide-phosphate synthase CbiB [Gemmatimonadota bacterium]
MERRVSRGGAAVVALAADVLLGEPPTALHPTVWMGKAVTAGGAARSGGTDGAAFFQGLGLVGGGAALAFGAAWGLDRLLGRLPRGAATLAQGLALKPALSLRALLAAAWEVELALRAGDLPAARRSLAWHLVSRETADLTAEEVAGAAIESIAENLSDGLVAPLLAFRAAGLPGAYLYRYINTCDAMLGYRTPHLEWFGKASAHSDDMLNLLPARLTAALVVLAAPLAGGDAAGAVRCAVRDAGHTASPNAGWPMAAMAGALGVRLTKKGAYELNGGARDPDVEDLCRARRLVAAAGGLAALLTSRS